MKTPKTACFVLLLISLAWCRSAQTAEPSDQGARKLRILVFGAHPDDAELRAGGCAIKWARLGHKVKLVSVTNGDVGHWRIQGEELAKRRLAEVQAADQLLGAEAEVMPIHDGELEPTLENRRKITRIIRNWKADVVISHRPWDYHPDHRYVGILVQDAAYMVTVPFFCPETPALKNNPVFLYSTDGFQKPYPFKPDVVVALDEVFDQKVDALYLLESQIFEGGVEGGPEFAKNMPAVNDVPARKAWLHQSWWAQRNAREADRFRDALVKWYGPEKGKKVRYAESFEVCEYGERPTDEELARLFPFFDKKP